MLCPLLKCMQEDKQFFSCHQLPLVSISNRVTVALFINHCFSACLVSAVVLNVCTYYFQICYAFYPFTIIAFPGWLWFVPLKWWNQAIKNVLSQWQHFSVTLLAFCYRFADNAIFNVLVCYVDWSYIHNENAEKLQWATLLSFIY